MAKRRNRGLAGSERHHRSAAMQAMTFSGNKAESASTAIENLSCKVAFGFLDRATQFYAEGELHAREGKADLGTPDQRRLFKNFADETKEKLTKVQRDFISKCVR